MKRLLTLIVSLFLVAVVAACEPSVTAEGQFNFTYDYPYCPTTDSGYWAADSVPLGCPVPDSGLGLRAAPPLVEGDGTWLFAP